MGSKRKRALSSRKLISWGEGIRRCNKGSKREKEVRKKGHGEGRW
jgi:hypothetical protein